MHTSGAYVRRFEVYKGSEYPRRCDGERRKRAEVWLPESYHRCVHLSYHDHSALTSTERLPDRILSINIATHLLYNYDNSTIWAISDDRGDGKTRMIVGTTVVLKKIGFKSTTRHVYNVHYHCYTIQLYVKKKKTFLPYNTYRV